MDSHKPAPAEHLCPGHHWRKLGDRSLEDGDRKQSRVYKTYCLAWGRSKLEKRFNSKN